MNEQTNNSASKHTLLWRFSFGRISKKPVPVILLGEGQIKVIGSCRMYQPIDSINESYHETLREAEVRAVQNAEHELNHAEKSVKRCRKQLSRAQARINTP